MWPFSLHVVGHSFPEFAIDSLPCKTSVQKFPNEFSFIVRIHFRDYQCESALAFCAFGVCIVRLYRILLDRRTC